MKIIITERQKKLIKENEDFTKEIAKDLFKRLPKNNFSEDDFLEYMKEKGSPDSITNEVLGYLESMGFPFEIRKPKQNTFVNDDSEVYETMSDDPNDWYFDVWKETGHLRIDFDARGDYEKNKRIIDIFKNVIL